jgi:hypothetical protein
MRPLPARPGRPRAPRSRRRRFCGTLATVNFEVEVYRNDAGEWVALAVEHGIEAKGYTEKEALVRVLEALTAHFKQSAR